MVLVREKYPTAGPPEGKLLFCFPYGGAGASLYRAWSPLLPTGIEVRPMQLPGRESRYREPLLASIDGLVKDLVGTFEPTPKGPFAFFGHSIGALIAFELTRELRHRNASGPALLVLSGYPAPHLTRDRLRLSHLPTEVLLQSLEAGAEISDELKAHPELLDLALPILRADLEAVETYEYAPEPPLDCPIVALSGSDDLGASAAQMEAWAVHTRRAFRLHLFQGGHFFLNTSRLDVIATIAKAIGELGD